MDNNQDFYDLLASVLTKQTFPLTLSNGTTDQFRPLTTAQLKNVIKTVVDSSLTQLQFSSAILQVMKESYAGTNVDFVESLNIVDKLLFIVETRIQSISSTITIQDEDGKRTIDLNAIKLALQKVIEEQKELMVDHELAIQDITLTVGIPTLKVERQIDEEIYKNTETDLEDPDQVRKLLGEAFIIELTKAVKIITIGNKTLDLSLLSFKERQKTIEALPALVIQQVINYVEKYKQAVNKCLEVDGYNLPIDGSLFSLQ